MTFPVARNELRPELLLEHGPGLKCRQRVERGSAMATRPHEPPPTRASSRRAATFRRPLLFGLGWLFLGVGIAGLVLPLLPGTVFLILSAACFARSSPRFEAWLLHHPRLGSPVRRWRETGAIPRYAKALACLSLAAS